MVLRWALALLAIFGGFTAAGLLGGLASDFAGFWQLPGAGFSASFGVVVVAYLAAPAHKLHTAIVALILGAVAAWLLLEPSFYPESYGARGAYEPTHVPIVATYVGGLLGLVVAALISRWAGPNNSFKPTPLRGAA
jgi:hypothetical protein